VAGEKMEILPEKALVFWKKERFVFHVKGEG